MYCDCWDIMTSLLIYQKMMFVLSGWMSELFRHLNELISLFGGALLLGQDQDVQSPSQALAVSIILRPTSTDMTQASLYQRAT